MAKYNNIPIKQLLVVAGGWYEQMRTVKVSLDGNFVSYPLTIKSFKETVENCKKKGFELQIITYVLSQDNRPTNQKYFVVQLGKQLGEINSVAQPQPQQEEAHLNKYYSLVENSKNEIQKEADWNLEKYRLEQKLERLQEKYDTSKEKNTELIAQYARLETICEKFEQSAKDMEGKASFTDVVKGLAGTFAPMLMGGMPASPQLAGGLEEQQTDFYEQNLRDVFGANYGNLERVIELLAQNQTQVTQVMAALEGKPSTLKIN